MMKRLLGLSRNRARKIRPPAIGILFWGLLAGSALAAAPAPVTICHIPPDDPHNFKTITVDENALDTHLAHGDTLGPCVGVIDSEHISSGKILFAAHNTAQPDADLELFVINDNGNGLARVSSGVGFVTPDIEDMPGGGWRIAYEYFGNIEVFDTVTQESTTVTRIVMGFRPDFNHYASAIVFQAGGGFFGIDIWRVPADGSSAESQLTQVSESENAEWPYFSPVEDKIVYFATFGAHPRHIMNGDGSGSAEIPSPGGDTVSHMSFKADGTEFVNSDDLTSYSVRTGAIGTLNDLKNTTTMMSQLLTLGYEEVPPTIVPGQRGRGTFALSVDWSRDGNKLVFDALVQDASTENIEGIAIFVYEIKKDKLTLIFGPEPFDGNRTNNFNYSIYTPKWVP